MRQSTFTYYIRGVRKYGKVFKVRRCCGGDLPAPATTLCMLRTLRHCMLLLAKAALLYRLCVIAALHHPFFGSTCCCPELAVCLLPNQAVHKQVWYGATPTVVVADADLGRAVNLRNPNRHILTGPNNILPAKERTFDQTGILQTQK